MAFNTFVGKTVVGIAVSDTDKQVSFMFSDGTAQALDVTVSETLVTGQDGLRSIQGVAAFLGHPIVSVTYPAAVDATATVDEYENLVYHSVQLNTASGNLLIGYLTNSGGVNEPVTSCSPTGDGLLTGDYTPPVPFRNEWN